MSDNKVILDSNKEFVDYVLGFYGEEGLYEFEPPATREEIQKALCIRVQHTETYYFEGDSTDRELVRDIMLINRGVLSNELEFSEVAEWVRNTTKK